MAKPHMMPMMPMMPMGIGMAMGMGMAAAVDDGDDGDGPNAGEECPAQAQYCFTINCGGNFFR
jgi:hypothetical protein